MPAPTFTEMSFQWPERTSMVSLFQQLFVYESTQNLVDIPELPVSDAGVLLDSDVDFQGWLDDRRPFDVSEITSQQWIKVCPFGYITELTLLPNGGLEEQHLFKSIRCQGRWSLQGGILRLEIEKGENRYHIDVVANKKSRIHCAIEYKNKELHSYLKVTQVAPL